MSEIRKEEWENAKYAKLMHSIDRSKADFEFKDRKLVIVEDEELTNTLKKTLKSVASSGFKLGVIIGAITVSIIWTICLNLLK